MFSLPSDVRAARHGRLSHSRTWRPVTLAQVDIDEPISPLVLDVQTGDRIWIEARKQHQVVGLLEALAGAEGLPVSVLTELTAKFRDAETSSYKAVPDATLPTASVVVPTICRDPNGLLRTINALLALDYPDFEIIVVDNRPGVTTVALPNFGGDGRVTVASEHLAGISAARNKGLSLARGEIVAFTDDDAVVDENWLRALGARFAGDSALDGVGGLVLPLELQSEPQVWFEEFYGGFSQSFLAETWHMARRTEGDGLFPYAPGKFGAGCNMAFRKGSLEQRGGFNTALGTGTPARGGEDLAMFIELLVAGGTLAFEPAAVVRHSHRRTESEFMRQVSGYGTGLTAMYTAIIVRDPTRIPDLIRRIPAAVRLLMRPRGERSPSQQPSYPRRTLLYQMYGMAYGPIGYTRSVMRIRRSK